MLAFDVVGRGAEQVRGEVNSLPPCVLAPIDKHLKTVTIVKPGALGERAFYNHRYHLEADSFMKLGHTFIDSTYLTPPHILFHELGHWYAKEVYHEYREAWERAAMLDYESLPFDEQDENEYMQDPEELFAEQFSYHFSASSWPKGGYDMQDFPRTKAMMTGIIAHSCKGGEGP